MLPRWQGGVATAAVSAIAVVLVVLDLTVRDVRRFWTTHAFTCDTVAGLLVLALTVLVVNQVVFRRKLADRSRALAAHAAIMLGQARRAVRAVEARRDGQGEHASAADEVRTYLLVLLIGAPVLIEDPVGRNLLEQAQALAGELTRILDPAAMTAIAGNVRVRGLDETIDALRVAATPLLSVLTTDERSAVTTDDG